MRTRDRTPGMTQGKEGLEETSDSLNNQPIYPTPASIPMVATLQSIIKKGQSSRVFVAINIPTLRALLAHYVDPVLPFSAS
ncbi:hypothetical protein COCNU_14G003000 [Cocos nucifera]|uniref:Uncharacterized protein n=1 Tax=Cocos nucifera TaxID=13894 RepID=A0A8K0IUC5_COCNU|nr:hypothetical protein COCNU_14G003000 [Cocos nucifera]